MKVVHRIIISLAAAVPLLLAGCSDNGGGSGGGSDGADVDGYLSGDENYQQYLKLRDNGLLDENGNYIIPENGADKIAGSGDILVSFADNRYLDMRYRLPDGTVVTDKCFLNAGDTIVTEKPALKGSAATTYRLDRFELRSNDDYDISFSFEQDATDTYKLTIPEDFLGKNITILPLGKYLDRSVLCRAVDYDENENEVTVDGAWSLLNDVYCKVGKQSEITTLTFSGITGYAVKFDFDPDYYYVVDTSDSGADIIKGSVIFPSVQPSLPTPDYEVKLRRFVNFKFNNKEYLEKIAVDGIEYDRASGALSKLKQQSVVEVTLKDGFRLAPTGSYISEPHRGIGSCSHTIVVPNASEIITLDIIRDDGDPNGDSSGYNSQKYESVNVKYINRDTNKATATPLPDMEYDLEITPKPGYALVDPFRFLGIGDKIENDGANGVAKLSKIKGSDCDAKIKEIIGECLQELIYVYLTRTDGYGGSYEYYYNGEKITANSVGVLEGDEIELTYKLNENGDYCLRGAFNAKKYEKTEKLEIKSEAAGKTLGLSDFKISVDTK